MTEGKCNVNKVGPSTDSSGIQVGFICSPSQNFEAVVIANINPSGVVILVLDLENRE